MCTKTHHTTFLSRSPDLTVGVRKSGFGFQNLLKNMSGCSKFCVLGGLLTPRTCKQSSIQFLRHCVWWPVHSWSSDVISYWIHSYRSHWDWRTTVDYPSVSTGFCAATCWRFWWLLSWSCSWWSGCWTCWIRSWSGLGHTWGRSQRRARVDISQRWYLKVIQHDELLILLHEPVTDSRLKVGNGIPKKVYINLSVILKCFKFE